MSVRDTLPVRAPLRLRARNLAWLAALCMAVALAPWLGTLHQVLHAPAQESRAEAGHPLHPLFADHASAADCLAFDQLSHAEGLPTTAASWAPAAVTQGPAWQAAPAAAPAQPAPYRARAPPHFA